MAVKKTVIVGTGSFAELMCAYIREFTDWEIAAFSADRAYAEKGPEFLGLPVIPLDGLPGRCPPEEYQVLIAVGYTRMNDARKRLFFEAKAMGYHIASFIHPSAVIFPNVEIGEGNIILEQFTAQAFVRIGSGNLIWYNVSLAHNGSVGSFNTIAGNVGAAGFVQIGNNCFLGKRSMVFDHVTLADYTLLGAGAFLKKDSKPYDVIVPARSVTLEGRKSTEFM